MSNAYAVFEWTVATTIDAVAATMANSWYRTCGPP